MHALTLLLTLVAAASAARQDPARQPTRTQVVLLGTGTPRPEPDRSGPATAVVVNEAAYLVDAGPGIVRRAAAAAAKGIAALSMPKLDTLFVTHLHSDHTVGLPDLIFTPWMQERRAPLRGFGPPGTGGKKRGNLLAGAADGRIC